jgi:hypothetical protein
MQPTKPDHDQALHIRKWLSLRIDLCLHVKDGARHMVLLVIICLTDDARPAGATAQGELVANVKDRNRPYLLFFAKLEKMAL